MRKLSVIIPAYNAADYLEEAIASVWMQCDQDETEIIVIDDGSDDNTSQIASSMGTTVLHQNHAGAAKARNAGLRKAGGELILFLDADDILLPDALSTLTEPLKKECELAAVFSRACDFISPELTPEQQKMLVPRQQAYGGVLPGCALLRREVFDLIGMFDETLATGETVAWQMSLRDSKCRIAQIKNITLRRRMHLHNTGRTDRMREMNDYMTIIRRRLNKR